MPRRTVTPSELLRRELDVYRLFCIKAPPISLILDPECGDQLQSWVGVHLKPEYDYASCISVMEAASGVARSAVDNGDEEVLQ